MRKVIDAKKRVSLAGVMEVLNLKPGDAVDISTDASEVAVVILPIPPRCAVCGIQDGLLAPFGTDPERSICPKCADAIACTTLVFDPKAQGH